MTHFERAWIWISNTNLAQGITIGETGGKIFIDTHDSNLTKLVLRDHYFDWAASRGFVVSPTLNTGSLQNKSCLAMVS